MKLTDRNIKRIVVVTLVVVAAITFWIVAEEPVEAEAVTGNPMPSGFDIELGETKASVFKKLGMSEEDKMVIGEAVYAKTLVDKRFGSITVTFKYGQLTDIALLMTAELCGRPAYEGMLIALDKKIGCRSRLLTIEKGERVATWQHCMSGIGSVDLIWGENEVDCKVGMFYHVDHALWSPKGTRIDL